MRLLPALICLSACAQFPALDDTISDTARDAPFPRLTQLPDLPAEGDANEAMMQARIAALQARATLLRQTDIAALQ